MVEDRNGYFSPMHTRNGISSLKVPDARCQEAKSDYLFRAVNCNSRNGS